MNNIIENNYKSAEPVVGMGATELCYSDRHPYTVVEIVSAKKIIVQRDHYTRTDDRGMSDMQDYEYSPNPHAPKVEAKLYKDGHWHLYNSKGNVLMLGRREEYYDYSF